MLNKGYNIFMNKSKPHINIRKASSQDTQNIYIIEKECFSIPWSENSILSAINNNQTYFVIAQENDKNIIGYAGLYFVQTEGYIYNIAVKKHFRKLGVGTRLVNSLKDFCIENSMEFLSLEVRKSNTSAIKLYEKMNFKILGTRKNFYSSPSEDAIIMTVYF